MDSDDEREGRMVQNQPYDETLDVADHDAEEVASTYTPTPRVPGMGGPGAVQGGSPPMKDSDDEFEHGQMENKPIYGGGGMGGPHGQMGGPHGQMGGPLDPMGGPGEGPPGPQMGGGGMYGEGDGDDDDDDDDDETESGDEDDDGEIEGAYDPADYEGLQVAPDIKELFEYITRYTPQSIELEHKLKPFIPDFIPSVGDIDAFIKVPRPDNKPDELGLLVLDEPCARQSDPTVLDLTLRTISKATNVKAMTVRSLENAEKDPKGVDNWIQSIQELHRNKPPPTVHYSKNMPDFDALMREWPPEFEELLKEVELPTADLDCDLAQYTDVICAILDIPVHKDRVQSLHVLFTLFSEFKNSQHFRALAGDNLLDNVLKGPEDEGEEGGGDRLAL